MSEVTQNGQNVPNTYQLRRIEDGVFPHECGTCDFSKIFITNESSEILHLFGERNKQKYKKIENGDCCLKSIVSMTPSVASAKEHGTLLINGNTWYLHQETFVISLHSDGLYGREKLIIMPAHTTFFCFPNAPRRLLQHCSIVEHVNLIFIFIDMFEDQY